LGLAPISDYSIRKEMLVNDLSIVHYNVELIMKQ